MKSLEEKGLFKFMDFAIMHREGMTESINMALGTIGEFGAKRLVIDSVTAILQEIGEKETRAFLHVLLGKLVKTMGVTTIMISEIPIGESKTGFGIEEFVADGLILLKNIRSGALEKKEIEIVKMRGCAIDRGCYEYLIDAKHGGINIVRLPSRAVKETAPTEKVMTGIEGLDKMLQGGLYRGSVTLLEGAAGIGKTTLALKFLVANVARGEKCLHLSLEEPVGQLYRMLDNYGIDRGKLAGKLAVESYIPESLSPLHYYSILSDLMERHQPKFLVMDSITAMQHLLPREDFVKLMRYLQLMCKEKELTVMLTATLGKLELIQESGISTLADNIIIMRYYELKEKLGREIMILKTRGSDQDKKVTPFEITGKGILVST